MEVVPQHRSVPVQSADPVDVVPLSQVQVIVHFFPPDETVVLHVIAYAVTALALINSTHHNVFALFI
jgi:hypothetical protein